MASSSNPIPEQSNLPPVADNVELGYAEETDAWRLQSHFFVSKIGGKPSWLAFQPLPASDEVTCEVCSMPCAFLLQVYAPIADNADAFHRTIFVFVCRNGECCSANSSKNISVLRCQLPRKNDFYSSEALNIDDFDDESSVGEIGIPVKRVEGFSKLCAVCGCLGDKQCAQCKIVTYCGKQHQLLHWKLAHKKECKENATLSDGGIVPFDNNSFLFPEYELAIETECFEEEARKSSTERSEEERMRDYKKYVETHGVGAVAVKTPIIGVSESGALTEKRRESTNLLEKCRDDNLDELESVVKKTDKAFKKFHRRIEQNPEQVIRYQRNGRPLWASNKAMPDACDLPVCPLCGSARSFEFQIMPHLLSHLDVDCVGRSIDWATVAVYTCSKNCYIPDNGYAKEVAFKQDFDE